jgi:protein SERAC1
MVIFSSIIAVHGLNGHPLNTWTYVPPQKGPGSALDQGEYAQPTLWLRDLLPQKIPNARVMSYGYDSSALGYLSARGIREHARCLLEWLRDEREDDEVCVFLIRGFGQAILLTARLGTSTPSDCLCGT